MPDLSKAAIADLVRRLNDHADRLVWPHPSFFDRRQASVTMLEAAIMLVDLGLDGEEPQHAPRHQSAFESLPGVPDSAIEPGDFT